MKLSVSGYNLFFLRPVGSNISASALEALGLGQAESTD
jgi:hypothetical protein